MKDRIAIIKSKIQRLKALDNNRIIFGSSAHGYRLQPVDVKKIKEFELENNIALPEDFKLFMTEIGAGAGPDYGIYNLEKIKAGCHEWQNWIGEHSMLEKPFDLTDADANELIMLKTINPKGFHYKRLKTANGILPIQTQGCTYYTYVVISGEQKGKTWCLDTNEFDSLPSGVTKEQTFLDWYEDWLDKSLTKVETKPL